MRTGNMGATDTPLTVALRQAEWTYARSGWRYEHSTPALFTLHYRTGRRHSIEPTRLPAQDATWTIPTYAVLLLLGSIIERFDTASFVTFDSPLWCGFAIVYEAQSIECRRSQVDEVRKDLDRCTPVPCRFAIGVLAEDLEPVPVYRSQSDEIVTLPIGLGSLDNLDRALIKLTSIVDYQSELDAARRRTGTAGKPRTVTW